jgi:hypothetical protein
MALILCLPDKWVSSVIRDLQIYGCDKQIHFIQYFLKLLWPLIPFMLNRVMGATRVGGENTAQKTFLDTAKAGLQNPLVTTSLADYYRLKQLHLRCQEQTISL